MDFDLIKRALNKFLKPKRRPNVELGCKVHKTAEFEGDVERISLLSQVTVDAHATLHCAKRGAIIVGPRTYVGSYVILHTGKSAGSVEIGADCSVHPYSVLFGHGGLVIGNKVRIGPNVTTLAATHIWDDPDTPIMEQGVSRVGIVIRDDVLIGAGTIIMDGAEIGRGCVIEPGTLVRGNIPEFAIITGNPLRIIGSRRPKPTTPVH